MSKQINDVIEIISNALNVNSIEIKELLPLKKGITNRSFSFICKDKKYIIRIPGEGTDYLINRQEEAQVYAILNGKQICDEIVYMNAQNGYKITEFLKDSRVCNANNVEDLKLCMRKLKEFHNMNLEVDHEFDIFKQIEYYESLWGNEKSIYTDYSETKSHVFSLQDYIKKNVSNKCLAHIDAVPDNFLLTPGGGVRLIDWEYAGMQDPHVDIAMFCIYALYDRCQVDRLIDIYFDHECALETRYKIYCYIAAGGLLWSNWCEYKRQLGIEFGQYAFRQYQYAKDYYKIFMENVSESR